MEHKDIQKTDKQRFDELKTAIKNICDLGFEPPLNMVEELSRLENEIIVNGDLIPTLTSLLNNEFDKFTRDINLLLKYSPENGLKISVVSVKDDEDASFRRSYGKISIILPTGRTISGSNGSEILREFVMFAGAENVKSMNIPVGLSDGGINIILSKDEYSKLPSSRRTSGRFKNVGSGLLLFTCMSTERKINIIYQISNELKLGAKVFLAGKPYNYKK